MNNLRRIFLPMLLWLTPLEGIAGRVQLTPSLLVKWERMDESLTGNGLEPQDQLWITPALEASLPVRRQVLRIGMVGDYLPATELWAGYGLQAAGDLKLGRRWRMRFSHRASQQSTTRPTQGQVELLQDQKTKQSGLESQMMLLERLQLRTSWQDIQTSYQLDGIAGRSREGAALVEVAINLTETWTAGLTERESRFTSPAVQSGTRRQGRQVGWLRWQGRYRVQAQLEGGVERLTRAAPQTVFKASVELKVGQHLELTSRIGKDVFANRVLDMTFDYRPENRMLLHGGFQEGTRNAYGPEQGADYYRTQSWTLSVQTNLQQRIYGYAATSEWRAKDGPTSARWTEASFRLGYATTKSWRYEAGYRWHLVPGTSLERRWQASLQYKP